jgi:DNA helicase II / ATP-dependent DNA helicase PcrA
LSFVDANGFANFKGALNALGLDKETLSLSYRSAREIMELASRVSGQPVDTSRARSGAAEFHQLPDCAAAGTALRALIARLSAADPQALTAIICKKKTDIKLIHGALAGLPGVHSEGIITFEPGTLVVNSHQVKGLEFTNVVLWNPSESDYRQTELDRNLLYVAITRACQRIDIIHWSPLAKALRPS